MDEKLLGYLLDALEPEEGREVERYLRTHPEAEDRLAVLRESFVPLAADDEPIEPPPDLWLRTLARVAEHDCRAPLMPAAPLVREVAVGRSWWCRADLFVAAAILLCFSLILPPALNKVRHQRDLLACQNNLRVFYNALQGYSEQHAGEFPNVAAAEPHDVAGIFVPILNEDRLLSDLASAGPVSGHEPPTQLAFHEVERMGPGEFNQHVNALAGCYAYSLGYVDDAGRHGPRLDRLLPLSFLPILADRPPDAVDQGDPGNSPNHGGYGQNVLYMDGHSSFFTTRTVGLNGDDIYTNLERRVAAGKNPGDAVLGVSSARP